MSARAASPPLPTAPAPGAAAGDDARRARLWEIDALRGLAVVAMFVFHFAWDLDFFDAGSLEIESAGWQAFARSIGSTFILLLGLSVTLDVARTRARGEPLARRTLWRFAEIGGAAALVSLATWLFAGDEFVRFGILHLLAVCLLLTTLTSALPAWANALLGAAMLLAGALLAGERLEHGFLLPLGWPAQDIAQVDYYPLLPWGGLAFLGVAIGRTLYAGGRRRFALPDAGDVPAVRGLRLLGRHSLPIYLLHQAVLLPLAWLVSLAA